MTSVGMAAPTELREHSVNGAVDELPEEMNSMRIRDDKVSTVLV